MNHRRLPSTGGMTVPHEDRRPLPITPFFGRASEVHAVRAALAAERCVVLHGPGGIGKTRIALEIADREAAAYWLDMPDVGFEAALSSLPATLPAGEPSLLVLDAAERVGAWQTAVQRAHAQLPGLMILVTTRTSLALPFARTIRLGPLAPPDARTFFIERATAVRASFSAADAAHDDIGALCAQLDGIPYALELAAEQTRFLAPQQVLARIDGELLDRTAARIVQPQLAACSASDQAAFDLLSVIPETWTVDDAEALGVDAGAVGRLADAGLIEIAASGTHTIFRMLGAVRRYGRARLAESGTLLAAQRRLVAATQQRIDALAPGIFASSATAFEAIDAMLPTIRAVVGPLRELDILGVIRAFVKVRRYFAERGLAAEALSIIDQMPVPADSALEAELRLAEGTCARLIPDFDRAARALDRAIEVAEQRGDEATIMALLPVISQVAYSRGDVERSQRTLERAVAALPPGDLRWGRASVNLAVLHASLGHNAEALAIYDDVESRCDDRHLRLTVNVGRSSAHAAAGRSRAAAVSLERARAALGPAPTPFDTIYLLLGEATAAMYGGDVAATLEAAQRVFAHPQLAELRIFAILVADTVALAAAGTHDPRACARILGFAEEGRRRSGAARERMLEPILAAARSTLRERLGADAFLQEQAAGAASTLESIAAAVLALAPAPRSTAIERLSPREREIARLVADGRTNREIADTLVLSIKTVENHLRTIFEKLGVTRRSRLASIVQGAAQ
jgi:non-specific serine/threonine protein kinase